MTITTDRLDCYILARQAEGAAAATIRIELAILSKGFTLAVRAKKLRQKPFIPKPAGDPSRVRQGFFSRDEVDALSTHLEADLADTVRFLFWSAWRVGDVRTLQWRDFDRTEQTLRLRPEHSKNTHGRVLPSSASWKTSSPAVSRLGAWTVRSSSTVMAHPLVISASLGSARARRSDSQAG
jgi:integrase